MKKLRPHAPVIDFDPALERRPYLRDESGPTLWGLWERHWQMGEPWREMQADGVLGPEYTMVDVRRQADEARRREQKREDAMAEKRHDAADVLAYLARHSDCVPDRELECAILFWRDGLVRGEVARRMGIGGERVKDLVATLRERVAAWRRAYERGRVPREGAGQ
jgi:hypothetical protein